MNRAATDEAEAPIDLAVLLFPAFSNHCLANVIEPLRAVNTIRGRICYQWRFVSLSEAEIISSSGLPVRVQTTLDQVERGDYLLIMPSYGMLELDTEACRGALRRARRRFTHLVGLDAGAWLMAGAGLLDGRRATIHRDGQILMAEHFPDVQVLTDRVVDDGDVLTCGGALTSFELALDLIERHQGALTRLEVAALFLYRRMDAPNAGAPPAPGDAAEAAMSVMANHIEAPLRVDQIAAKIGLTRKRLEQKCRARYGIGPQELYRLIRLREARWLVETTSLSVAEVAVRSGYADPSAMTRAFRRQFGATPRAVRERRDRGGQKAPAGLFGGGDIAHLR